MTDNRKADERQASCMGSLCGRACGYYQCARHGLDKAWCLVALAIRLFMARIFFNSGLSKLPDWQNTVDLFAYEYKTPLLPPEVAALLATGTELTMPVLLVLGLATRLAVLPLMAMTLVIQFTYLNSNEHWYWLLLLAALLTRGAGRISVDFLLGRKWCR